MTTAERNEALVDERYRQWLRTYNVVRSELEVVASREVLDRLLTPYADPDAEISLARIAQGIAMARLVSANDRAAAMVAASIVVPGIKPLPLDDIIGEG